MDKTLEKLLKEVKRMYQLIDIEVYEKSHSFIVIMRARNRLNSRTITKTLISGRPLPLNLYRMQKKEIVIWKNDLEKSKQKVIRNLLIGAHEICFHQD